MPDITESLTIRILGDSSSLQAELKKVVRDVSKLKDSLSVFGEIGAQINRAVEQISRFQRPLLQISNLFRQIHDQAQTLGQLPITLNIAPALSALAQLSAAISVVAAQLRQLSAGPVGPGGPGGAGGGTGPIRRFAQGGFVAGSGGVDRVPALLSAGEFVLRRDAVDRMGVRFLNALNQQTPVATASPPLSATSTTNNNNFGGLTVNVSQPGDVNGLVRDLRFQGFRLRNRRG